ncbi:hypothetical protein NYE40_21960 [Paenibacillus sp. FSL W8-1187]|uniref:hypothetical protein n=1 Tax=Paenibacillus sp. FSL W8-1187 TaxID=2975339 RepID=UPI0030DA32B6
MSHTPLAAELNELRQKTSDLMARLDSAEYEEFVLLVEQREQVLQKLQGSALSEEDRDCIRSLQQYDSRLLQQMGLLKTEAAETLFRIRQSKNGRNAYEGYGSQSYFIDKKN